MQFIAPTGQPSGKRPLKVYYKCTFTARGYIKIPEIRLVGKWLEKIGFKCGQTITVIESENRMLIINKKGRKVVL